MCSCMAFLVGMFVLAETEVLGWVGLTHTDRIGVTSPVLGRGHCVLTLLSECCQKSWERFHDGDDMPFNSSWILFGS